MSSFFIPFALFNSEIVVLGLEFLRREDFMVSIFISRGAEMAKLKKLKIEGEM